MRLFKIDPATFKRAVAGVAVVALAPAAKNLRDGEPHYVKARDSLQCRLCAHARMTFVCRRNSELRKKRKSARWTCV